ncbi:MAG TPA: membrane protein [Leeuwenhoekiella sp.]|nr:membrane protein [Leeuwenhoekiella sp.]
MRYWCTISLMFFFSVTMAQHNLSYKYVEEDSALDTDIKNATFKPLETFNFGLKNGLYWVKIDKLTNTKNNVISIEGHHVTSVTGHSSNNVLLEPLAQVRYPSLEINKEAIFPLFIKIQVEQEAYFPIHFYSRESLIEKQQVILFGYGLFYGALLFMSVIMIIMFTVTGEDNFWTYAILLLSIGIALAFRDNIPYLFGWKDAFYYNLELATHILIGIFGGYFAYSFIDLRNKKAPLGKVLIFTFAGLAVLSMFIYWVSSHFMYYFLADALILLAIASLWAVSFLVTKKTVFLYVVFGIFAINIYFIFEFLVLYNFGLALLYITPSTVKWGILAEMIILCFALLNDWHKLKQQTLIMRLELQKRTDELQLLSQYKREDDHEDDYLENLIENHDLTNKEVKILQMLSMNFTEAHIAHKLQMSTTQLSMIIKLLYIKIGINDKENDLI